MSDEERFQPLVDADLAAWPEMPGRLLHVLAPGLGVDLEVAAGVEELGRDRPLQPGSRFRIASVTKPFVAAAALRLVEQGRVSLDDTVARLLEGEYEELLRRGGYETDAITLRHLLTHTSGIYDFAADAYGDELTDGFTAQVAKDPGHRWTRLEQITWAVDYGKPYGPPGTVFALLRHRRLPRRRGARADHRRDDGRGDPRPPRLRAARHDDHVAGDDRGRAPRPAAAVAPVRARPRRGRDGRVGRSLRRGRADVDVRRRRTVPARTPARRDLRSPGNARDDDPDARRPPSGVRHARRRRSRTRRCSCSERRPPT